MYTPMCSTRNGTTDIVEIISRPPWVITAPELVDLPQIGASALQFSAPNAAFVAPSFISASSSSFLRSRLSAHCEARRALSAALIKQFVCGIALAYVALGTFHDAHGLRLVSITAMTHQLPTVIYLFSLLCSSCCWPARLRRHFV